MKAPKRNRPVTQSDVDDINRAMGLLKSARYWLRTARELNTLMKVLSAIKSCKGALNNAQAHLARHKRTLRAKTGRHHEHRK